MKIDKKISYKGWIKEVLVSKGWDTDSINDLMRICVEDIKGMAAVWLKDGNNSYFQTYMEAKIANQRNKVFFK